MASRYLLESSGVDGYLLENASGVLLKETLDTDGSSAGTTGGAVIAAAAFASVTASVCTAGSAVLTAALFLSTASSAGTTGGTASAAAALITVASSTGTSTVVADSGNLAGSVGSSAGAAAASADSSYGQVTEFSSVGTSSAAYDSGAVAGSECSSANIAAVDGVGSGIYRVEVDGSSTGTSAVSGDAGSVIVADGYSLSYAIVFGYSNRQEPVLVTGNLNFKPYSYLILDSYPILSRTSDIVVNKQSRSPYALPANIRKITFDPPEPQFTEDGGWWRNPTLGDLGAQITGAYGFISGPNALVLSAGKGAFPNPQWEGFASKIIGDLPSGMPITISFNISGLYTDYVTNFRYEVRDVIYDPLTGGLIDSITIYDETIRKVDDQWIVITLAPFTLTHNEIYLVFEALPPPSVFGTTNRWLIDEIIIEVKGQVNLVGDVSFSSRGYRSRDGDCLVDYPIDPCNSTSFVPMTGCINPTLTAEVAQAISTVEDNCILPIFADIEPPPLSVYNNESDGCPLHDENQALSYNPPSRGSELDLFGNLRTRLLRVYRSTLAFSGHLTRGRRFLGVESFSGRIVKKDKKRVPAIISFNSSVSGIKNYNPILALGPWAWFKADNPFGNLTLPTDGSNLTTWIDLSGNNNHMTSAGIRGNGDTLALRPVWRIAGSGRATTHLPAVDFMGTVPAFSEAGYFSFDGGVKVLNVTTGYTLACIVRDYSGASLVRTNYVYGCLNTDAANNYIGMTVPGGGTCNWNVQEGGSNKSFGASFAHTDAGDAEVIVLRCAVTTGQLKIWVDGSQLSGGDTRVTPFSLRFLGRYQFAPTSQLLTRYVSFGEFIIFDKALSDSEVSTVNSWLSGRI